MNYLKRFPGLILLAFYILNVTACGQSASDSGNFSSESEKQFTIAGTLTGLTGSGVIMDLAINQKTSALTIGADGSFTFPGNYNDGTLYTITITFAPAHQICVITDDPGRISGSNITGITVTCTDRSKYTVGGTISGLVGALIITADFNSTYTATAAGIFSFPDSAFDTFTYTVGVDTHPAGQLCTITNGTGTIAGANVNNIQVDCKENITPTATVLVPEIIQDITPVVIRFDETMNTNFSSISGTLFNESDGGAWSTTSVIDDTLTFTPLTVWTSNSTPTSTDYSQVSLQLSVTDLAGNNWSDHLVFITVTKTPYFVDINAADDTGDGLSPETAKKTIKAAIDVAVAPAAIAISKGTFLVTSDSTGTTTHPVLKEDVSLIGGFTSGFRTYDGIGGGTEVTDTSARTTGNPAAPNRALEAGVGITKKTLVSLITFNGSSETGTDYTTGAWVHSGSAPALRNNTFNGGEGSLESYGLLSTDSSPDLELNLFNGGNGNLNAGLAARNSALVSSLNRYQGGGGINSFGIHLSAATTGIIAGLEVNGGAGSTSSTGIYLTGNSNLQVDSITVSGGTSPGTSYGVYNDGSAPTFTGLFIDGGSSAGTTYGIYSINGNPIISRNHISGGSGTTKAVAIFNSVSTSNIFNNILLGGSGSPLSIGIENSGSSPLIRNNTIDGGLNATTAYGIYNQFTSNPAIQNNIVFRSSAATSSYCVYEDGTNADPAQIQNNDLVSCGDALYYNYVDGSGCGSNDQCLTTSTQVNALVDTATGGNISVDPGFVSLTSNPPTYDNLVFTVSSPVSVTAGGLNGTDQGWGFTTDLSQKTRPSTGIPWAMGPLEP